MNYTFFNLTLGIFFTIIVYLKSTQFTFHCKFNDKRHTVAIIVII